ncbi:MAG: 2-oxoacid:acceptor oxidoreductase subunit alpha [Candidatus Omnitrophica bacterium]|nr:2-oxoacid:acceptor oxidoreductase subunit alpha [Candidatus Omnitrophota bacterium]
MKADEKAVNTGIHFMDGDSACCEGAIAAGCRFVAGYPITPSTEVVELIAQRFPKIGGIFIQMEDEIASSIAISGASWAGAKAMTVTSGPGFSLMMEHIGYAVMTETPCVFVNVQRGGPSTGLPTLPGQQDIMQCRWGSHGDYEVIALSPNSPQECFDLTIQCFNLAEKYRVPVFLMMDECVGHMSERVVIPPADEIEIEPRHYTEQAPGEFSPYNDMEGLVPRTTKAGDGHNILVTGLTHDDRGYPDMSANTHQVLVDRLIKKIRHSADDIIILEEDDVDGADIVVVSYGISSRVATRGVRMAREKGLRVGMLRLVTVWPFPENRIRELADRIEAFVVVEMNQGQIMREVQRCSEGRAQVAGVLNYGGAIHPPEEIYQTIAGVSS